jgi:hypothetical protein
VLFRTLLIQNWSLWIRQPESRLGTVAFAVSACFPVVVLMQYALGGALRHLHMLRTEHALGAVFVLLMGSVTATRLLISGHHLLRICGLLIASSLSLQLLLGLGAMMTRFGYADIGYVAVVGSLEQAIVCSLHTVVGMFLFASASITSLTVCGLYHSGAQSRAR